MDGWMDGWTDGWVGGLLDLEHVNEPFIPKTDCLIYFL